MIELVLLAYLSPRIFTDIVLTGFPHTDTLAVPSKRSTNRASAPHCVGACRILCRRALSLTPLSSAVRTRYVRVRARFHRMQLLLETSL
jgi:hypothetical protein